MVSKKSKSGRVTTKMREKIRKKVREHYRKKRKEARKDVLINGPKKRAKKDLGIPNLYPFKKAMLLKAVNDAKKGDYLKKGNKSTSQQTFKGPDFEDLALYVENRGRSFASQGKNTDEEYKTNEDVKSDVSVQAYYKEFKKVIEAADVVLEILDCRDPLGCRPKNIERMILESGFNKRIILVLNKVDLVPKDAVVKWLKYLRNEFPTVAFRSSTQVSRTTSSSYKRHDISIESVPNKLMKKGDCLGADSLMNLLKNYCRNNKIKTSIVVGVIGYPNVGKSSVINSLKRYKACKVGSDAGVTKSMQQVNIDNNIKLLDCPGIVFRNTSSANGDINLHLKNIYSKKRKSDYLKDSISIIKRCGNDQISRIFGVVSFDDPVNFLILLAKKRGRILKKGIPDIKSAAEILVNEWNSGAIPFYTLPPDVPEGDKNSLYVSSEIVNTWSKEFNIDEIVEAEKIAIMEIDDVKKQLIVKPSALSEGLTIDDNDLINDYEPHPKTTPELKIAPAITRSPHDKKVSFNLKPSKNEHFTQEELMLNRMNLKKMRSKISNPSTNVGTNNMEIDDYNFDELLSSNPHVC